jgi:hypothetical protein
MKLDKYPIPRTCQYCNGNVRLVSNSVIYGKEFGSGLAYVCESCKASVGVHNDCVTPLGSLADDKTKAARVAAHAAFDKLWQGKGTGARDRAYAELAAYLGKDKAHIDWLSADECQKVLEFANSHNLPLKDELLMAEWRLR